MVGMEQPRPNRDAEPTHLIRSRGGPSDPRETWCAAMNCRIEAECIADTTCIPCLHAVMAAPQRRVDTVAAARDRIDQLTRDGLAAVDRDLRSGAVDALQLRADKAAGSFYDRVRAPLADSDLIVRHAGSDRTLRGVTVRVPSTDPMLATGTDLDAFGKRDGKVPRRPGEIDAEYRVKVAEVERNVATIKEQIQTELMAAFNTVDTGPVTIEPPAPPPRCSFVPSEGLAAIVLAKARGGTTEGDIRALRDRFGCKAVSTHEILGMSDPLATDALEDNGDPEPHHCCADHVGHVLSDRDGWVSPIGFDPFVADPEPPGPDEDPLHRIADDLDVSIVPGGSRQAMVNRCIARESAAFGGPPITPRDASAPGLYGVAGVPNRRMGESDESLRARIHAWMYWLEPSQSVPAYDHGASVADMIGSMQPGRKLPTEHTVILRHAVYGFVVSKCYDPTITRLDHGRGEMRLTTTCSTSTMWWLREQYEIGTTLAVEAGSGFSSGSARIAAFAERSGGSYDRVVTMTIHALNVQPVGAKP